MKTSVIKFSIAIMLSLMGGCGPSRPEKEVATEGTILFVGKTFGNPYFVEMAEGATGAAREGGIALTSRSGTAEDDIRTQLILIQGFLAEGGAGRRGIVLAPASSGAEFNEIISAANRASIPVAIVDTEIPDGVLRSTGARVLTTIASDNYQGALLAGQFMGRRAVACGSVLLLVGVPQQATAVERSRGFEEGLRISGRTRGCQFRVVRRIANWNRDEARRVVAAMIPTEEAFVGVFGSNDQMALGALEAFDQTPRETRRPIVVGFDAVPEAVEAVRAGRLDATMRQKPREMGRAAVSAIRAAWRGQPVQRRISIPVELVAHTPR